MSSDQSSFRVNNDGHVIWTETGQRVCEQELVSLSEGQRDEFGYHAKAALDGPPDIDLSYQR